MYTVVGVEVWVQLRDLWYGRGGGVDGGRGGGLGYGRGRPQELVSCPPCEAGTLRPPQRLLHTSGQQLYRYSRWHFADAAALTIELYQRYACVLITR